jgi:DnaJ-class molecular chaperone
MNDTMARNFYDTLGVARTASDKEIRAAYRKLARQYHPDVNPGDKAAEARFKEVAAAYEVVGDPENRKKYDKYGDQWEHADQIEEMQRQRGGSWSFNSGNSGQRVDFDFGGGGGDFGSIFENLFRRDRGGPRRQRGPRAGQNIETPVMVSLEEAFRGTTRTLQFDSSQACTTCNGTGDVNGSICDTCGGIGQLSKPRRIEVKVPAGVATGSRVRIAGEGHPGFNGGPKGDLYLQVTVSNHPRFERKGDDLYVDVDVPVVDAVLGGEVEVPTIDGRVALRIKELTQNGASIRLGGKGMPKLGKPGERGDMYARVRVQIPKTLTAEQRALFERLRRPDAEAVGAQEKV